MNSISNSSLSHIPQPTSAQPPMETESFVEPSEEDLNLTQLDKHELINIIKDLKHKNNKNKAQVQTPFQKFVDEGNVKRVKLEKESSSYDNVETTKGLEDYFPELKKIYEFVTIEIPYQVKENSTGEARKKVMSLTISKSVLSSSGFEKKILNNSKWNFNKVGDNSYEYRRFNASDDESLYDAEAIRYILSANIKKQYPNTQCKLPPLAALDKKVAKGIFCTVYRIACICDLHDLVAECKAFLYQEMLDFAEITEFFELFNKNRLLNLWYEFFQKEDFLKTIESKINACRGLFPIVKSHVIANKINSEVVDELILKLQDFLIRCIREQGFLDAAAADDNFLEQFLASFLYLNSDFYSYCEIPVSLINFFLTVLKKKDLSKMPASSVVRALCYAELKKWERVEHDVQIHLKSKEFPFTLKRLTVLVYYNQNSFLNATVVVKNILNSIPQDRFALTYKTLISYQAGEVNDLKALKDLAENNDYYALRKVIEVQMQKLDQEACFTLDEAIDLCEKAYIKFDLKKYDAYRKFRYTSQICFQFRSLFGNLLEMQLTTLESNLPKKLNCLVRYGSYCDDSENAQKATDALTEAWQIANQLKCFPKELYYLKYQVLQTTDAKNLEEQLEWLENCLKIDPLFQPALKGQRTIYVGLARSYLSSYPVNLAAYDDLCPKYEANIELQVESFVRSGGKVTNTYITELWDLFNTQSVKEVTEKLLLKYSDSK